MGACTVTVVDTTVFGNKKVILGRIAVSASYATGGDTFAAADLGLDIIDKVMLTQSAFVAGTPNLALHAVVKSNQSGQATWPANAGKLALFGGSTAAAGGFEEFANAADASGYIYDLVAYGV